MGTKHALVLPVLFQAHFFSIYRHAVELAKRGITVTFVGLGREIDRIKTSDELQGLDFHLLSYRDFGSEHHFQPRGDPMPDMMAFTLVARKCFQPILDKLVADQKAGLPGPSCIIADRLLAWPLAWPLDAAKELGIPYYQYWSCGAIYARELQARASLFDDGILTLEEGMGPIGPVKFLTKFEGYLRIPGLPALQYRDMTNTPSVDVEGVVQPTDYNIGKTVGKAHGLIVNSCYALEAPQIDALQQAWNAKEDLWGTIPKLFLIGPNPNAALLKNRSIDADLKERGTDSLDWLDTRPPRSVVFVCFGSIAHFSASQVQEVALALEASEQSFLWVASRSSTGALPSNFEERTRDKGLTVKGWVPQLQILQHPATAGFVTHCGWNSVIESINSGVPMAAWPQIPNDQPLNCRYLVDVLKIAVEVRIEEPNTTSASTGPDTRVGLEEALRLLVSEEGNILRSRVQELRKNVEAAVADGGPSEKALNDIVDSIPHRKTWARGRVPEGLRTRRHEEPLLVEAQ